jgi:multiple sugar transport system substrate-binding protein
MGVAGFEKVDPSVHIDLTDVGAGSSEYTKLSTAIAAGSGAPCIAQVEYDHLPAYEAKPGLVNIAQYGASQYKSAFPGWVWQLMSNGSAVYALGQDIGPVGFAYRPAIFTKYHLAVPKTWAQFGAEAVTLHKDNPNMYMTYFGNDDATMQGLTSQAGGQMFQENGSSWKVELNNPSSQKVMSFWGNLIKEGVIPVESLGTPAYGKAIASGEFASYLEAAWDPTYLGGYMVGAPVQQQLLMTNLPQWSSSGKLYAYDFGGSSYVVTSQCPTADRAAAVKFLGWLFTSKEGITLVQGNGNLKPGQPGAGEGEFAAASARATVPDFNEHVAQFAAQPDVFGMFNVFSGQVRAGFTWSPFENYISDEWPTLVTSATSGSASFSQALATLQSDTVTYAQQEGFTVSS